LRGELNSSPCIFSTSQFLYKEFSNRKNSSNYTWNAGIFCRTDYFETVSQQLMKVWVRYKRGVPSSTAH
jgi:hypothetical protein